MLQLWLALQFWLPCHDRKFDGKEVPMFLSRTGHCMIRYCASFCNSRGTFKWKEIDGKRSACAAIASLWLKDAIVNFAWGQATKSLGAKVTG